MLPCEGRIQLAIAAITGASQGDISKILIRSRETGTLSRTSPKIHKCSRKPDTAENGALQPVPFKSPVKSRVHPLDRTSNFGPHHQLTTFNWWVSVSQASQMPMTNSWHGNTMIGTFVTGGIVFSLTSPASNYITMVVGFEFQAVTGWYIYILMFVVDSNVLPSIMVWGAFHFRDKSELVIVEGPMNQQVYWWVLR